MFSLFIFTIVDGYFHNFVKFVDNFDKNVLIKKIVEWIMHKVLNYLKAI